MLSTNLSRLASASLICIGLTASAPVLADITVTDIPVSTAPIRPNLVTSSTTPMVMTGTIDSSVKRYMNWIAGRPARKEAARLAALAKTAVHYGPLPPASIIACESKGSYTAENPISSASGRYQIVDGTWNGYGGYEHASHAPPHVQDAKARELWAGGAGRGHWRQCL